MLFTFTTQHLKKKRSGIPMRGDHSETRTRPQRLGDDRQY